MDTINLYMCLRNNDKTLKFTFDILETLEQCLHNTKFNYFFYENDSIDNTRQLIKTFMLNRNGNFTFENCNNKQYSSISSLERTQYMAKIRNKMKSLSCGFHSDYSLLLDTDIEFTYKDIETMLSTLKNNKSIAMVIPFGYAKNKLYKYYDTYALLTMDDKNHLQSFGLPSIIEVKSGFGGIAILLSDIFDECKWDFNQKILKSEHLSLCRDVRCLGKIALLTYVKVGWNTFK